MKKKALTVGELRKALEGVPDDLEVRLSSDSGVDQGEGEIIIEGARRVNYSLPEGKHFEDGSTGVDYFDIYANDTGDWDGGEDADVQCSMCGEQYTADEVKEAAEMGEPFQFYD